MRFPLRLRNRKFRFSSYGRFFRISIFWNINEIMPYQQENIQVEKPNGFTLVEVIIAASISILIAGSAVFVLQMAFQAFGQIGSDEKSKDLIERQQVNEILLGDLRSLLPPRKEAAFEGYSDAFSGERLLFIASESRWEPVAVSWRRHVSGGTERIVKRLVDPEVPVLETRLYSQMVSFQYGKRNGDAPRTEWTWTDHWTETNTIPTAVRFQVDGIETLVVLPESDFSPNFDQ